MGDREYVSNPDGRGSINISEDVIISLASDAALHTEGVSGLTVSPEKDTADLLGKKTVTKGIKIQTAEDGKLTIDVCVLLKAGCSVRNTAEAIQKAVAAEIESVTGLALAAVNIHVCGIELSK